MGQRIPFDGGLKQSVDSRNWREPDSTRCRQAALKPLTSAILALKIRPDLQEEARTVGLQPKNLIDLVARNPYSGTKPLFGQSGGPRQSPVGWFGSRFEYVYHFNSPAASSHLRVSVSNARNLNSEAQKKHSTGSTAIVVPSDNGKIATATSDTLFHRHRAVIK